MIITVIGLSLIALLVLVAVTAVNGDAHLTGRDLDQQAGLRGGEGGDRRIRLSTCTPTPVTGRNAPASQEPDAVNQKGSTTNRRAVPGSTGGDLRDRTDAGDRPDSSAIAGQRQPRPQACWRELDPMKGTFRVRSTGFAGDAHVAITATFKPASFLDYVYFTQLETSDPVTYGHRRTRASRPPKSSAKRRSEKAAMRRIPRKRRPARYCDTISFVGGDNIKGPMHTNDAFVICGSPTLGRSPSDPIEVSAPPKGWYSSNDSSLTGNPTARTSNPELQGTFRPTHRS